ncbi:MAG: EamA family transporter [Clostridia bacterium]|nr:EamA family transporter [Clostridia bacterium]MBQ5820553.1 EamA family transporter [Clostridia bacterium]
MLDILSLLFLSLLYTFQSLFAKLYSDHYTGDAKFSSPVFSVVYGFVVALITLALNGFSYHPSPATFWMGFANGLILLIYNVALIEGSRRGSYSYLMICNMTGGLVLPMVVFSIAGFEQLTFIRWIGFALTLLSFVLLNLKKGEDKPKKYFYALIILLALVNGTYGILLSVQSRIMSGAERAEMLVTTFLFAGIFSLLYLLLISRRRFTSAFRMPLKAWMFSLGSCVSAMLAVNLLMFFYSYMSITVVNATNQCSVLALSALGSTILFKERLRPLQIVGIGTCLAATALLNL